MSFGQRSSILFKLFFNSQKIQEVFSLGKEPNASCTLHILVSGAGWIICTLISMDLPTVEFGVLFLQWEVVRSI